jgi:hypothetical protein
MQNAIYKPSDQEIGYLTQLQQMPGYQVYEKIVMSELDLMQVAFMNVEAGEEGYEKKLAAKHALAKGGAVFYAQVCEKVAGYIARLGEKNTAPTVLPDMTESLFEV